MIIIIIILLLLLTAEVWWEGVGNGGDLVPFAPTSCAAVLGHVIVGELEIVVPAAVGVVQVKAVECQTDGSITSARTML